MNEPLTSKELTQRDLYKPENVVAYLRSIENESIAGRQYRHAADEIERLRAELTHREAYMAQFDLVPKGPALEPPVDVGNGTIIWAIQRALHFQRSQLALEPDVARIFREFLSDYRNRLPEALHVTASAPPSKSLPHGPARIAAQFAHAVDHILDDYAEENAQTGEVTVSIPADQWKELNRVLDLLGDDPHEVLHDLIGVNDPSST